MQETVSLNSLYKLPLKPDEMDSLRKLIEDEDIVKITHQKPDDVITNHSWIFKNKNGRETPFRLISFDMENFHIWRPCCH